MPNITVITNDSNGSNPLMLNKNKIQINITAGERSIINIIIETYQAGFQKNNKRMRETPNTNPNITQRIPTL
ncbi:MAG: hypothetical protein AABZ46_04165 [Nitrospirota bacterium]